MAPRRTLPHHAGELLNLETDHQMQLESLKQRQLKEKAFLKRVHRLQVVQANPVAIPRSSQKAEIELVNQVEVTGKLLLDLLRFLATSIFKKLTGQTCPRRILVPTFVPDTLKKAILSLALLKGPPL